MLNWRQWFTVLCATLYFTGLSCTRPRTLRVVDGREVVGERISELAYAAYLRGTLSETRGLFHEAEEHYQAALSSFENAELHTALGRVLCFQGNAAAAQSEFDRGETLDELYSPLFLARANCQLLSKHWADALLDATRAQGLDPDSRSATEAAAKALRGLGRLDLALQWEYAFNALHPLATRSDSQRLSLAVGSPAPARGAAQANFPPASGANVALPFCKGFDSQQLAGTVRAGDSAALSAYASVCRVSPFQLAAFALELGRSALAFELGLEALALSPTDANVRALILLAALRSGKLELSAERLATTAAPTTTLSPQAEKWLAEVRQVFAPNAQ